MLIPEELKSRVRNVADSYLNDILMFGASAQVLAFFFVAYKMWQLQI